MTGQRQTLRDEIAALGGSVPPAKATIADLTEYRDNLVNSPPNTVDRPAEQTPRTRVAACSAGRPLWNDTICRNCLIRGQTVCPYDEAVN